MSGNAGATGGAAGGGAGAGNAGVSPDLLGGGAGAAGAGGAGQGGGDGGAGGTGGGTGAQKTWIDDLPEDIRGEASLKLHKDVGSLAKSYLSAQRMVGADKIPVPTQHTTPEEWSAIHRKLGLPDTVDKYDLKPGEGFNPELLGKFKKVAHEAGILPAQAEKVLALYADVNKNALEAHSTQLKAKNTERMGVLQKEWGQAFDQEMETAISGMNTWITPEEKAGLKERGLNTDPFFIKLMNKLGKAGAEDKIRTGGTAGSFSSKMAPAEALSRIQTIMGDLSHPHWNGEHPGHKSAVEEMTRLNEFAYPSG